MTGNPATPKRQRAEKEHKNIKEGKEEQSDKNSQQAYITHAFTSGQGTQDGEGAAFRHNKQNNFCH